MSVTRTVVNRPTTTLMIFILVIGFGLYAASGLAIDLFPEINPPVLVVFTNYSGAGPEEIEQNITRPLESQLSNVGNIQQITSTSSSGSSQIVLEFTWGSNMAEAANEVRDSLEFVREQLPDEATSPQILKFDPSLIPILQLEMSGNRSSDALRELAEDIVQPRLEQIEGVSLAAVNGGRERVIRVEIPQNRLDAYDLTMQQVANAVRSQNVQVAGGSITEGNTNFLISTEGEYRSIDEIREVAVTYRSDAGGGAASRGGGGAQAGGGSAGGTSSSTPILLRDLAEVSDGYRERESAVYVNGEPGVFVVVQKQSGTNSVEVADAVREKLPEINEALPIGTEVGVIIDTTDVIRASLEQVSTAAITGAILAVVILFVFLRSVRTTLIISLAIPVSLVVTLSVMYFSGLTLNLMTLTGLALGVGMLVDNSIVVLENIYRYREKGAKLRASAVLGSQEMINAIVASTLTTISVFAPLAVFRRQLEFIGELFSGLAFTVVISLGSSLLVAIFLIPVLSSRYLPISSRKQRPLKGILKAVDDFADGAFRLLDRGYQRLLAGALSHKLITLLVAVAILGGSLALIPEIGFELTPEQPSDTVQVSVELPVGTRLERTEEVMERLAGIVRDEVQGYDEIITSVGERSFGGFLGASRSYRGTFTVTLPEFEERVETSDEVEDILRAHFDEFPGVNFSFDTGGGPGGGPFNAPPIDVLVQSEDLERTREIAHRIRDLIRSDFPEVTEPSVDLEEGLPQVELMIDRARAYELGLNVSSIGEEVRARIDGVTASKYRSGGSEYDILVVSDEPGRDQLVDLDRIFVMNDQGRKIPLSSFASTERGTGPVDITRENQRRTVHVTGGLAPGSTVEQVTPRLRRAIFEAIPAEQDLVIEFGGDYADLLRYGRTFAIIMLISVFLVFGVMASQFESFVDPFIIIFTVPFLIVGVLWLYFLTGQTLSLFTAVGLVVLVGIIVNNGIVFVDYTNLLRKRGLGIRDALIEAGGNRLRPILMTTLTTVLGLVPVAFFRGEGATLVQPIGQTVVGGLTVGTVITLFVIPVIYAVVNRIGERREERRERRRTARIEQTVAPGGQDPDSEE
ncbi:MAG: efflux RND transporter permease subunit [Spirochaetaceae bacterium]